MRRQNSILDNSTDRTKNDPDGLNNIAINDARLIMSAAILGFSASVLSEEDADGRPFTLRFDIEKKEEEGFSKKLSKFKKVIKKINSVLSEYIPDGQKVDCGFTPTNKDNLITGCYRSESHTPEQRQLEIESETGKEFIDIVRGQDTWDENVTWEYYDRFGYRDRGAYTGVVDDPEKNKFAATSTIQMIIPNYHKYGHRWIPLEFNNDQESPWGLIGGMVYSPEEQYFVSDNYLKLQETLNNQLSEGIIDEDEAKRIRVQSAKKYLKNKEIMPKHTMIRHKKAYDKNNPKMSLTEGKYKPNCIAGYVHGMTQAIYIVNVNKSGVPYETAVDEFTSKLASCIPCAFFMQSTGYCPSSIHIDSGESWIPFYPLEEGDQNYGEIDRSIDEMNDKWFEKCREWLKKGVEILNEDNVQEYLHERLNVLRERVENIQDDEQDLYIAGNLILDASTVHEKELIRLDKTLM